MVNAPGADSYPIASFLYKEESRIAKYTSDGKPVKQSKGKESISTRAATTDSTSETSDIGTSKAKGIAKPLNYNTKYISKPSSS